MNHIVLLFGLLLVLFGCITSGGESQTPGLDSPNRIIEDPELRLVSAFIENGNIYLEDIQSPAQMKMTNIVTGNAADSIYEVPNNRYGQYFAPNNNKYLIFSNYLKPENQNSRDPLKSSLSIVNRDGTTERLRARMDSRNNYGKKSASISANNKQLVLLSNINCNIFVDLYTLNNFEMTEPIRIFTGEKNVGDRRDSSVQWLDNEHVIIAYSKRATCGTGKRSSKSTTDFFIFDIENGKKTIIESFINSGEQILAADVSSDDKRIAYATSRINQIEGDTEYFFDIIVYDAETSEKRVIYSISSPEGNPSNFGITLYDIKWSPDGLTLAVAIAENVLGNRESIENVIQIISAETGELKNTLTTNDFESESKKYRRFSHLLWEPDSSSLYFIIHSKFQQPDKFELWEFNLLNQEKAMLAIKNQLFDITFSNLHIVPVN